MRSAAPVSIALLVGCGSPLSLEPPPEESPFLECGGGSTVDHPMHAASKSIPFRSGFSLLAPGARDVDGDGFDDIVFHDGEKVSVAWGRFGEDVADLDAWVADGNGFQMDAPGNEWIISASIVGDVNADGLADIAVYSELYDCECPGDDGCFGESLRYLTLVHGRADAATVFLGSVRSGDGGFGAEPDAPHPMCGAFAWPAPAGDVNGDGYADFILGSGDEEVLIYGKPNGDAVSLTSPGDAGWRFPGAQLALAGDVDGDGFSDLVGYDWIDVVLYRGRADGPPQLTTTIPRPNGANNPRSVGLGDVNGDGLADVGIHDTRDGKFMVWFGQPELPPVVEREDLWAGVGGYTIGSDELHDTRSFAPAGDVDGDGLDDVLIHDKSYLGSEAWSLFVAYGKPDTASQSLCEIAGGNGGFAIHGTPELHVLDAEPAGVRSDAGADILVHTDGGYLSVSGRR